MIPTVEGVPEGRRGRREESIIVLVQIQDSKAWIVGPWIASKSVYEGRSQLKDVAEVSRR
jgi:hypothetical protein